ncbi:MAG: 4-hydroxy-tetrahydrodipicolinate synthase [Deltaproteobacteria bacterium]|nr:4-hydroxy-tetrahydrodipicolinate synthase [Deltaproteobacteria bacterium]
MRILSSESSSKIFKGVYTALVTQFLPDGSLDLKNFDKLLDAQLAGGVHGVVPCGTTGESPVLTSEEKLALVRASVAKCKGRALVIAGTGSNDTVKTLKDSKAAADAGADALLVVTPYYNKPSQAGLEAHFRAVADESTVPVILYNVPGRTGVSLAPSTVAKLSLHPRILAIKEATGNMATLTEMRLAVTQLQAQAKKPFYFLSGDDPTFWPFLANGGDGVISVSSNVLPACMRMMYEDWNEGRTGQGLALHEKTFSFFNMLFVEANPVPVKALLASLGRMGATVRAPLAELQPESFEKLKRSWDALLPHLRGDRPREDIHGQR